MTGRVAAAHAARALAFVLAPFPIGLVIATVTGWQGLASHGRMLAGWAMLLVASVLVPLFLTRAARVIAGHETERADRRMLWTGIAALVFAGAGAASTPWRELGNWLAATLTDLTGFSVPVPVEKP